MCKKENEKKLDIFGYNTIKRIKRNRIKITIFINTISKYLIGGIILHHEIDIYISHLQS